MKRLLVLFLFITLFVNGFSQWAVFKTSPDTIEAKFIIEDVQMVKEYEVHGFCKNYYSTKPKLFYIKLMCNEKIYLVIYESTRKNKNYKKMTIGDTVSLKIYPLLVQNRFPDHNSFQKITYKKYHFWLTYGLSWASNIYYSPYLENFKIII